MIREKDEKYAQKTKRFKIETKKKIFFVCFCTFVEVFEPKKREGTSGEDEWRLQRGERGEPFPQLLQCSFVLRKESFSKKGTRCFYFFIFFLSLLLLLPSKF